MALGELRNYLNKKSSLTTLAECSFDSDGKKEYLVQNRDIKVYNFDNVMEDLIKDKDFMRCSVPCSPDTLYMDSDNNLYFIEFKNSHFNDIKKYHLRAKLCEALLMLKLRFNLSEDNVNEITYIVVHKKNPKNPAFHKLKNGRCPNDLRILTKFFKVKVATYDSLDFDGKCYSILGRRKNT